MRLRALSLAALGLALAACGNDRNHTAAQACGDEIAKRMAGKSYELSVGDFARNAKSESADTLLLSSAVTFDKGLSTESKQTFDCRVRFDAAGVPSVLYLQFNWNTSELKQAR